MYRINVFKLRKRLFQSGEILKQASRAIASSCQDSIVAYGELMHNLKSVHGLMGKPGRKSGSYNHLKSIGTAMILAPSPEPFTDLIGLALIGFAKGAEKHKPPLTLCEIGEESHSILKGIRSSNNLSRLRF